MDNRAAAGLIALASSAALVAAAAPTQAATTDDSTVTFELAGGGLNVTAPASTDLGAAATTASVVSGNLGDVTVTDDRGLLVAAWTVTAVSTDFTTGAGSADETVPATNVTYTPGLATGTAVTVPTPGLLGGALPLPVVTGTGVGNNTATWDPTLSISLAGTSGVAGTYTGTITHSVS